MKTLKEFCFAIVYMAVGGFIIAASNDTNLAKYEFIAKYWYLYLIISIAVIYFVVKLGKRELDI